MAKKKRRKVSQYQGYTELDSDSVSQEGVESEENFAQEANLSSDGSVSSRAEHSQEYESPLESKQSTFRSRKKYAGASKFQRRIIFADRPAFQRRSNDIVRESWSFHSLFPSMRTWVPLIGLPFASWILVVFGIPIKGEMFSMIGSLFQISFILAIVFFFLESTKARVSHALKDFMIHCAVLGMLFFMSEGVGPFFEVFILYFGGHMLAHAVDFHIERSENRFWLLIFGAGMLVFFELLFAVAYFETSLSGVL
jgi:fumarate reductase subunit D